MTKPNRLRHQKPPPPNRRARAPAQRLWRASLLALAALAACGCVVHRQVQYFAATDPETGFTNYYKMTVTGSGGMGVDYHLQAGYFSAAAVDILRGSMPKIPTLDMDIEHEQEFRKLVDRYYAALVQEANASTPITNPEARYTLGQGMLESAQSDLGDLKAKKRHLDDEERLNNRDLTDAQAKLVDSPTDVDLAARAEAATKKKEALAKELVDNAQKLVRQEALVTSAEALVTKLWTAYEKQLTADPADAKAVRTPPAQLEDQLTGLARLVWFGSLSESDIISVGMTQSTDPYQFRKLVFWTTAANIDLNEFATEIDGVLDSVVSIASSYRQQAKARKVAKQSRRTSLETVLNQLETSGQLQPGQAGVVTGLLDLVNPPPVGDTDTTAGGE